MMPHKKIGAWLVDYGYALRGTLVSMVHRTPPHDYLGHRVVGKDPVVLIPGILNQWGFMKNLGDKISLAGHPVYVLPELGYNTASIAKSAGIIRSLIEKEDLTGVVLVAHSKGGLIGKYVLSHLNADSRVLGVIAVATPFSGSALANVIPHDSFKELRSGSEVIEGLEAHQAENARIISIIPEYDNHIWADEGSFLDGALENVQVPVKGHHKVLFSRIVIEAVLASIEKIIKLKRA
jgi:triacylglycerol lipase